MKEKWKQWQILFSWAPKPLWTLTAATKLKDTCSLEGFLKIYEKPGQCIKKQRLILLQRSVVSQLWFSRNHVQM